LQPQMCGTGGGACQANVSSSDHDWSLFGLTGSLPSGPHDIQLSAKVTATPGPDSNGAIGPASATAIVGGVALGG
jgi:hypothetical protein